MNGEAGDVDARRIAAAAFGPCGAVAEASVPSHGDPPASPSTVSILGLLQNMWVRDPARAREIIAKHGLPARRRMIATWMPKTPSGRNLQQAFGDLFELITWENVASKITGRSDAAPRANHIHIAKLLRLYEPTIVIAFGLHAVKAMQFYDLPVLIRARHPSPRAAGCKTLPSLDDAAGELRRTLKERSND